MRFQYFAFLLLGGLAYGQAVAPAQPPAGGPLTNPGTPAANVGPDEAVITIKGFCADSTLQGDACQTVIPRAQFDKIADALQPGMSPTMRRQAATWYARMLRMSAAGEKRGLDKGPSFDQSMALSRMQVISKELNTALLEESRKISDADIEEYYKKNAANYEQAVFARIVVPHAKQIAAPPAKPKAGAAAGAKAGAKAPAKPAATAPPTEAQQKVAAEAMTKLAATLRERAVKGEDPDKLQKEAYAAAAMPGKAPTTRTDPPLRRNSLPVSHQSVMDLKPGEVSEVISDPNDGHYIYKLISKDTLPLDKVKPEIITQISGQRYRDAMQGFQGNVTLNDAYFGPTRPSAMPQPPKAPVPPAPKGGKDSD
jgi:hypothetical protein